MPIPEQYLENSIEYREQHPDEFPEPTSIEDKFDWHSIRMLCVEAVPKHKAYGMLFPEYKKRREQLLDEDTTERRRLSFYFPNLDVSVGKTYAAEFECSYHRYMLLTIELGVIKFNHDHLDAYQAMKQVYKNARKILDSDGDMGICKFEQMTRQSIYLGTASGAKNTRKHLTLSVPEWMHNTISEKSEYMGMCMSDMIYLCYCIGVVSATPFDVKSCVVEKRSREIISSFEMQFDAVLQVIDVYRNMKFDEK